MKLKEIISTLDATILSADNNCMDMEITSVIASDLMSDVLSSLDQADMLLTCLNNNQVIRTSLISGIKVIIIVKDKPVDQKIVNLAHEEGIILLSVGSTLFETCGKLYEKGIGNPVTQKKKP